MSNIVAISRILRHSAVCAFADYASMFSWRVWSTAYVGRMVAQVLFFALIGLLVGDQDTVRFLLIGNAVAIASYEGINVIASTTWERRAGTLSLLVSCPSNPLTVFAGRSVHWIATGVSLGTISFFAVAAVFGVPLPWPRVLLVPLLIAAVSMATFSLGLLLGAFIFRLIELRLIVINTLQLVFMAFCGVNVPVDFWPAAVQRIASILPVTHGLQAVRLLLDGADATRVLSSVALELAVAVFWLVPAVLAIRHLVDGGRRTGSIELSA